MCYGVLQHNMELVQRLENLAKECQQTFAAHETLLFVHVLCDTSSSYRWQHAVQQMLSENINSKLVMLHSEC